MTTPAGRPILRRAISEGLGTTFLVATIVGSGIMGHRLSGGDAAMTLLVNSLATGAILAILVAVFGPISGAHLNPAVTLVEVVRRRISQRETAFYMIGQVLGGFVGVAGAHIMFGEAILSASHHARAGVGQLFSEFIATFGLFLVIHGTARRRPEVVALAIGGYIMAAYWFTASTAFANPAVTLARCATDSFAGIRPRDVPGFVVAQLLGAAAATMVLPWLTGASSCRIDSEFDEHRGRQPVL